jgi:NhaP-type Na+/H+ or K+/H+ antiporter
MNPVIFFLPIFIAIIVIVAARSHQGSKISPEKRRLIKILAVLLVIIEAGSAGLLTWLFAQHR